MTTNVDGTPSTTRYQLDNGQTLTAIGAESSTFYLYGMGVIGTFDESWSYILQDGAGSTRQLVDTEGAVQLSISYTPWGDTLEVYGSGLLNLGYMGGVYDAGTGLIYMGNGQYYDPSTGRFLTRGMKEESTNPYTPWSSDPAGMLIGPFGFLALLLAKKKKHTKLDAIIVVVILLALMGFGSSIAMPVQAAGIADAVSMPITPRSYAVQAESATVRSTFAANPGAPTMKLTLSEICGNISDPITTQQIGDFLAGFIYQFLNDLSLGTLQSLTSTNKLISFLFETYNALLSINNQSDAFMEGRFWGRQFSTSFGIVFTCMSIISAFSALGISVGINTTTGAAALALAGPTYGLSIVVGGAVITVVTAVEAGALAIAVAGAVYGGGVLAYTSLNPLPSLGGGNEEIKLLNPEEINYSQRSVKENVMNYIEAMKMTPGEKGSWDWEVSGPIRVMKRNGKWVTYDNRRLMAAQEAGLESIPVEIVKPTDIFPGKNITWEEAFKIRFNDPRNLALGGPVPNEGLVSQPIIATK